MGVVDVSVHLRAFGYPGAAALHLGEAEFSTELVGNSSQSAFKLRVSSSHIFLVDSIQDAFDTTGTTQSLLGHGVNFWKVSCMLFGSGLSTKMWVQNSGYALIAEISRSELIFRADNIALPPSTSVRKYFGPRKRS